MKSILEWIFSESGAGWVFGAASLIALVITRRRDLRPKRVVVKELRRIQPILVRPSIRERIKITFDRNDVKYLGQIEASIFNEGRDTIREPEIQIEFPKTVGIIDGTVSGNDNGAIEWSKNVARVRYKFLNAKKEHHQVEQVSIITDGRIGSIVVTGSGEGWSVRHLPLPTAAEEKASLRKVYWSMPLVIGIAVAYGVLSSTWFGIPSNEVSLRALTAVSPLLALVMGWMAFVLVRLKRLR